jgi:hypothetical protein
LPLLFPLRKGREREREREREGGREREDPIAGSSRISLAYSPSQSLLSRLGTEVEHVPRSYHRVAVAVAFMARHCFLETRVPGRGRRRRRGGRRASRRGAGPMGELRRRLPGRGRGREQLDEAVADLVGVDLAVGGEEDGALSAWSGRRRSSPTSLGPSWRWRLRPQRSKRWRRKPEWLTTLTTPTSLGPSWRWRDWRLTAVRRRPAVRRLAASVKSLSRGRKCNIR